MFPVGLLSRELRGEENDLGWSVDGSAAVGATFVPGVGNRGTALFAVGRLGRQSQVAGRSGLLGRQGTHGRFVEPHNFARLADRCGAVLHGPALHGPRAERAAHRARARGRFACPEVLCSVRHLAEDGYADHGAPAAGAQVLAEPVNLARHEGARTAGALSLVCSHTFGFRREESTT